MNSQNTFQAPMDFSFYLPVNIVFGAGKADQVGAYTKGYGKKAMVVTGGNSSKQSGLLSRVLDSLQSQGVDAVVFDQVTQNPLTTTAHQGALFAQSHGCDVVVAVGGGSILDCAKAIAFLAENPGDVSDYIYNRKGGTQALPVVAIPTTCGTGSEANGFAVLSNPDNNDKKGLRRDAIIPKVSIVDPVCMMTMPPKVLASVGFDALCHCMEAYTSKVAQPMSDALCLYAMKLLADNLVDIYQGSKNMAAWEAVTLASTIGGMVIYMAGTSLGHGMEHPASGLKDIVHGHGLAALTPVILEASLVAPPAKFAHIAQLFGGSSAQALPDKIRELLAQLDMTTTLGTLGLSMEDVEWMAENSLKVAGVGIANYPVAFTQEQIADIYRKAM